MEGRKVLYGSWNRHVCRKGKFAADRPFRSTGVNPSRKHRCCSLSCIGSQVQRDTSDPDNSQNLGYWLIIRHQCICMWSWTEVESKDCMKSASYEYRKMSARRGVQFVPIGMPTICWKTFPPKTTKMLSTRNSSMLKLTWKVINHWKQPYFSCEPISKTGYWLGVCHGWFHLHGLTRATRSESRELQNEKFLPIPVLELTTLIFKSSVYSIRPANLIYKREWKTYQVEYRCALCYL